jgi:ABC-type phosphate transport system substrate-binding protein
MKRLLVFIFCLLCGSVSASELVVIAHPSLDEQQLTKKHLINIYMGRTTALNDGKKLLPLDQKPDSILKERFYLWLVDKNTSEVNAYWARLSFTGKATPPHTVENSKQVVEMVSNNPSAIGYAERSSLTDSVKVIERVQ